VRDGVRILRAPVLFRLSKGAVMPTFGWIANRLVLEHDVIHLHLPQFDAAGIALRGRLLGKPTVITYHCDLLMPPGLLNQAANQAVHLMNHLSATFTHRVVTYTQDYAENSPFLRHYLKKLNVILPPVELPAATASEIAAFSSRTNPEKRWPVIGMAARFATEKGVEVLLNALPELLAKYPNLQVQFAGPYQGILGEEGYFERLNPAIETYQASGNWKFVGSLDPERMAFFYPNLDLLVLSSINSTEAFGLVQIEAMLNGVPCVASDLPGVRQPIRMHGLGKVIPIGDSSALARSALEILQTPEKFKSDPALIRPLYQPETVAAAYEKLFAEIQGSL